MLGKLQSKKEGGFTLIEIVLALAIAGLIIVIVFLAVTGAQRSRRDTARRDYVNRLAAAVTDQWASNDSNWNCATAGNRTILDSNIDKPTLNAAIAVAGTAASTTVVNTAGGAATCTLTVGLENGGTYARTVTP